MAQQPPQGPQAPGVTDEAFSVLAEIDVDEILTRLTNETRRLLLEHSQAGLTGADLAKAVTDGLSALSDTPAALAGRGAATEAFNLGRNLAFQENADKIQTVVRTEVLDDNTCGP